MGWGQGVKGIHKVREEFHNRVLNLRRIEAVLLRCEFEHLWEVSDKETKDKVRKLIKEGDREAILTWMREHPSLDIGEKPVRELRKIAKSLQIKNYSRMGRVQLLMSIREARNGV